MFQTNTQNLTRQAEGAEKNYIIQPNDFLALQVYTNEGERLIDPDFLLRKEMMSQAGATTNSAEEIKYLVTQDGLVKFPMIGAIKLDGLTLLQAEELLQKEYEKYYQKPFVVLRYQNKRVVVLGAPGGQVIPLANDNMTLVEVLALAKGVENTAKANNIRVIRGDQVMIADLTTFEGYKKNNIIMVPGDVVYVEPVRRPFLEGIRDYGPVITIFTSLTTLIIVLTR